MDKNIIPADKKYRNRMLLYLAGGLAAGGLVAGFGMTALLKVAGGPGGREQMVLHVLFAGLLILFLTLFPLGLYLLAMGKLTIAARRFPPPGVRVIRDTLLIQGEEAVARGRIFIFSSCVLMGFSVWGVWRVRQLARVLGL